MPQRSHGQRGMGAPAAVLRRARDWVSGSLAHTTSKASFFETVIRLLGGLLSAYDLSGDQVFLRMAVHLGDKLVPNCEATTTGDRLVGYTRGNMWLSAIARHGRVIVHAPPSSAPCSSAQADSSRVPVGWLS